MKERRRLGVPCRGHRQTRRHLAEIAALAAPEVWTALEFTGDWHSPGFPVGRRARQA